ncbi:MAG: sulfurtransferase [Lysobacterales bacterium RIFOXYD1_FULL_69_11]|nr:MAG: sulfurtransferase [Xanthomonadales bacterium RIFOXYA1_FULL_69_10]OHE86125.1 MAG: sulfurtransferase [Xanthomonadales bacterium RIFOXYD1_FULL_69_11]
MILNVAAYHFAPVADPDALADRIRAQAEALDLRGTVLVAPEGVNLFLAGTDDGVHAVLALVRDEPGFEALQAKFSHSDDVPFARLKVKRKNEIIAFRRDGAVPLDERAPAVSPPDLARWIEQGHDDTGRRLVLLDTRNREEVGHGTFAGALTLPIDNFVDLPEALAPHRESLADATVVSFCTGGIRCEKAALWLRADGMDNLLQLDGGILGYFEQVGGLGYEGGCFVFDERVALDPGLKPVAAPHADA